MDRRIAISFLLLLSCLYIPGIGKDFSTRGEAREALIVQSIVNTGNWVLPRGYSDVVPSKPPLMHWVAAAISKVVGQVNEITVRLPSVLFAVSFLFYFFLFLYQRYGLERAWLTTLITALSFEWFRAATGARVDVTFCAGLCAAMIALFRWSEKEYQGVSFESIIFLTLATLAKGPAALVLAFGIVGIFNICSTRKVLPTIRAGLIVFLPALLFASLWYLSAYRQDPETFFNKVWYENAARFLSTQEDEPHKQSIWYLYGTLLLGFMPWTFVAVPYLKGWVKNFWQLKKLRPKGFDLYCLIVCLLILAFFSIPSSKRSVYLLPLYPFLAFGISSLTLDLFKNKKRWLQKGMLIYSILIVFSNAVVFSIYAKNLSAKPFAKIVTGLALQEELYSYHTEFYGLSFYLDRKIFRYEERKPSSGLVFMNVQDVASFEKEIAPVKPEVVVTSDYGITKPNDRVTLLRIRPE